LSDELLDSMIGIILKYRHHIKHEIVLPKVMWNGGEHEMEERKMMWAGA